MIKCAYQTPREICYAVNDCVGNLNLTPRPWIFQEPNTCHWWLVPSAEWPAYKHGKLYFGWANDERTGFLVGFHVEKGLGTSVKAVYRSEEHTSELQSRRDLVCRLLLEKK